MKRKLLILLVVLSILLLLPACQSSSETSEAEVTQVIDGDTIVIAGGYHVRYIGIDTPEKDEPYYSEAKNANQALVEGKVIRLERDTTDKDKYGRLLRYIYINKTFINAEIVRQGYAYVYPKDLFPDIKYYDLLKEAEAEAQREERGIWGN